MLNSTNKARKRERERERSTIKIALNRIEIKIEQKKHVRIERHFENQKKKIIKTNKAEDEDEEVTEAGNLCREKSRENELESQLARGESKTAAHGDNKPLLSAAAEQPEGHTHPNRRRLCAMRLAGGHYALAILYIHMGSDHTTLCHQGQSVR